MMSLETSPTNSSPSSTQPTSANTSTVHFNRRSHPYFTKRQQEEIRKARKDNGHIHKELQARHQSCKLICAVGKKLGFPQDTICTAQCLYHRFYLFYSLKEYSTNDISITCLFVACKIEETLKKLKDIMAAAYTVRHPEGKEIDPENVSEERRRRIIAYERLILETICFDFQVVHAGKFVIKFIKVLGAPKELAEKAWELVSDAYYTPLCLTFPPHTIAAGSIYLASRLLPGCTTFNEFEETNYPWWQFFCSRIEDIEATCHEILDLYIQNGPDTSLPTFRNIKIALNRRADERREEQQRKTSELYVNGRIIPSAKDWEKENELIEKEYEGGWKYDAEFFEINTNHHTVCFQFASTEEGENEV